MKNRAKSCPGRIEPKKVSDIDLERNLIFKEWLNDLPLVERMVLACLSRGDSVQSIARASGFTVRSVYNYVYKIRRSYLANFS